MTDTLSRTVKRRLFLGLTATILSPAWANFSAAGQAAPAADFPAQSASIVRSQMADNPVDAVFGTRWGIGVQDYVLGPDGQLRRTSAAPRTFVEAKVSNIDASKANQEYSHIGTHPVLQQRRDAAPCDASPISAAQTAWLVTAAAHKYDVDPGFALAVATVESGLDRARNSPKGARGPMQLMPATAGRLRVKDICDPADNIDGGVRFLSDLFATYRNPLIVAAAYNAGEARVQEYGGIPPFPETVNFVAEVIRLRPGLRSIDREPAALDASVNSNAATTSSTATIPSTGHRQWVGGVMQF